MTEIKILKKSDFKMKRLEGVAGDFVLEDAFGKPEGAPVCVGMWEVRKSEEPVIFDYVHDCVLQYALEGSIEAEMNGKVYKIEAGDFLYIPQAPDTEVKWRATKENYRAIYVTYPHWR